MLNAISSIIVLNLISITIPGFAQYINKVIFTVIQLDIIPADMIYDYIFTFEEENNDPLTPFFDQLGYSNINSIQNMGSAFLFLLFELALLFFVLPITMILRINKLYEWLKRQIIWNSMLRFLIQEYMTLLISSYVNIVKFKLDFKFNGTSASILTCFLLLAICFLLPFVNTSILWRHRHHLNSSSFQVKYGTLV